MSIFSRKNSKPSKKVELKLHIAQESREPVYDLSDCELRKLPKGFEAQAKYFNKTILKIHTNFLQSICDADKAANFSHVIHLDLHSNKFSQFPPEIFCMTLLQILDLSHNEIKAVPDQIGILRSLRKFYLRDNQVQHLPASIGDLSFLEDLDLDGNPLRCLPVEMGRLINLKQLNLHSTSLTFPPQDICKAGLTKIISYLRKSGKISDDEFEHAKTKISTEQPYDTSSSATEDSGFSDVGLNRRSDLHRKVEEELNAHAELAKRVAETRISSIKKLAQEEDVIKNELLFLQRHRDEKRKKLVNSLRDTLDHADDLIKLLQKRQQIKLEDTDPPSLDSLPYFTLTDENRRKILESMHNMLAASETAFTHHRDLMKNIAMTNPNQGDVNPAIQSILVSHQANQAKLAAQVAVEEIEQMKAFECLQKEHDARRRQIVVDIRLIEAELCRLTQAELERKVTQGAASVIDFLERRKGLVRLLAELRKQKELRESELHRRLMEMEEQKTRDQEDYWLVQYQRLIDRKPAILNKESFLSGEIREVLAIAGAEDYLSNFEYHRITRDQFPALTDEDLIRIGVSAVGVRKAILEAIVAHAKIQKDWMVEPSAPILKASALDEIESSEVEDVVFNKSSSPEADAMPSAPPAHIVARFELECCICQDAQCSIIFLPCGHVCCCEICSAKVYQCPLCRVVVQQSVLLS
nr:E3 ubiquitin protein ligase LRSAM1 [Hymenolepis microstoma]